MAIKDYPTWCCNGQLVEAVIVCSDFKLVKPNHLILVKLNGIYKEDGDYWHPETREVAMVATGCHGFMIYLG
ncbi:MAG UNVERIFIED_CONTAM: hypothetical protein LVQ98_04695 [Rickettsiaceae bacterium]|jgi:hypothetical protein